MAAKKREKLLECDYLVVGAGAAPLAFIDTLLTELPESKIILVDKKGVPGGQWVDAYGFVRLHQPSVVYGLASKQLEGNWLQLLLTKGLAPWRHRASKKEILTYFGGFVDKKVKSKQIEYYPNTVYDFGKEDNTDEDDFHFFSSVDGSTSYKVKVNTKLINGTHGECIIPHDSPLQFPVDEKVRVMTPNQIYDAFEGKTDKRSAMLKDKYVVLGAGKTGMDCIVYLQRKIKVNPNDIAWVISNDVWMMNAAKLVTPEDWPSALMKCSNDQEQAALALEEEGKLIRLHKNFLPSQFRFPMIQPDELKLLRKIKAVIRRGRATAIRCKYSSDVTVEFGSEHPSWKAFAPVEKCVFVHATSPGPRNDNYLQDILIFNSAKKMTLQLLFAPPISLSMSVLAKIEAARRMGTLNIDAMRRISLALVGEKSKVDEFTEDDLLNLLLKPIDADNFLKTVMTQPILFSILDDEPMMALKWVKQNRLSLLSIPGLKANACNDIRMLCSKAKIVGLSEKDVRMLEVVGKEIKPLEGM